MTKNATDLLKPLIDLKHLCLNPSIQKDTHNKYKIQKYDH